jgi:hypothetical protein
MDRVSIRIERRDLNWMVEMKILERPWIGEYTYTNLHPELIFRVEDYQWKFSDNFQRKSRAIPDPASALDT